MQIKYALQTQISIFNYKDIKITSLGTISRLPYKNCDDIKAIK